MNDPFLQLPVLPVVVPLGVAVFGLLIWRLRARRLLTLPRAAVAAAVGVYAAGIVGNTIFPIYLHPAPVSEPWTPAIVLVPFADYEIEDALTNVLVFAPIGLIVPLLLARTSWLRVTAVAAAVSLTVELSQLAAQRFFGGGHIADVSDLLSNVAGGVLGYALFVLLTRIPRTARLIEPFRWTTPAGPGARTDADRDDAAAARRPRV